MSPLLKLCGNHSEKDTAISLNSSAEYIGFVFAKSKRQVARDHVIDWLVQHDHTATKLVALFVNATIQEITEAIEGVPFDVIQCHGNESAEQIAEIKKCTGLLVWKVIHHREDAHTMMRQYEGIADGFVIDCKVGNQWGGTGVSFDWRFVPKYINEGRKQHVPVFIAGGINPSNIDKLLDYEPDGIDVSSGIEENGQKSIKLVLQLEGRMNRNVDELS